MLSDSSSPTRVTLDNGIRLLGVQLPHAHSAVLCAQLNVGSRYESEQNNGLSHFLEHMLYRGTRRYPSAHSLSTAFEQLGGTLLASTSVDTGVMALRVPPVSLQAAVPIFAEAFAAPVFNGIDIERGIVTEEILEMLDDDGNVVEADTLIRERVFQGHGLGLPITGTIKHVERFTVDLLHAHHARHYCGANTVVVVAGPAEPAVMLAPLESAFAELPAGEVVLTEAPLDANGPQFTYVRHAASQTDLRVAFRAPSWASEDEPAMEVLVRLLDDGMATRLYHRLCDELGLCYEVSGAYETYCDSGLVELCAESVHERAPLVLKQLLTIVRELKNESVPDEELERVKRRHRWQFEQMWDDVDAVAEYFGVEALTGARRRPSERQAMIDAVTPAHVLSVARRWLRRENLQVVAVGAVGRRARSEMEHLVSAFD